MKRIIDSLQDTYSENEFISLSSEGLIARGHIDPWDIIRNCSGQITPSRGLAENLAPNAIPVINVSENNPHSAFLSVVGVKKGKASSDSFHIFEGHNEKVKAGTVGTTMYSMVSMVLEGECAYTDYSFTGEVGGEVVSAEVKNSLRLTNPKIGVARKGEILVRDRRRNLVVIDKEAPAILLTIACHRYASLFQLQFDKNNGILKSIADFTPQASRKIVALRLIEKYGRQESVGAIESLRTDEHHMIRWLATRAMINLNPGSALEYLSFATKDENEEIANTAKSIISKFSSGAVKGGGSHG